VGNVIDVRRQIIEANSQIEKTMPAEEIAFRRLIGILLGSELIELGRPIIVSPVYSCYGCLSSAIIELQGSPAQGTIVLKWGSYAEEPSMAFLVTGRSRLVGDGRYGESESKRETFQTILNFWKTLNIPKFSRMNSLPPEAKPSVVEPIPTNLTEWYPFQNLQKPVVTIKEAENTP
jgi:hypothetical protein